MLGTAAGSVGLLLSGAASNAAPEYALVDVPSGRLRGYRNGAVHVFKGIPYGGSTGGTNRFQPPTPPTPWSGVRDALEFGPSSPQPPLPPALLNPPPGVEPMTELLGWGIDSNQSEDCLVLNVWTPALDTGKRAVMVRLHGGGFTWGSGSWPQSEGTALARKGDVVVVTVNHRLGAVGFLQLADIGGERYANSGHAGMLDLVQALEWVRHNISQFGGDPGNVTIFGESGGGSKVCALLAMPSARGLFHRAIVQSGAGFALRTRKEARDEAAAVLAQLQIDANNLDQLNTVPIRTIGDAGGLRTTPFADGRILPANPGEAVAAGASAAIPLLIGSNQTETTQFRMHDLAAEANMDEATLVELLRSRLGEDTNRIVNAYKTSWPKAKPSEILLNIEADMMFRINAIRFAERKLTGATAPVYMYIFDWRGNAIHGLLRAAHGLEVPFTMNNPDSASAVYKSQGGRELADKMSDAWLAFAKTGNPNTPALPKWPSYSTSRRATMIFANQSKIVDDPYGERAAWATIEMPRLL